MRAIPLWAVLTPAVALSGCAATSGQDWLDSPLDEQATSASERLARESVPPVTAADRLGQDPSLGRPRLQHTVTLGEDYAIASAEPGSAPGQGGSLQVNVNTYVPVNVNTYGGYGYGLGYYGYAGGGSPARPASPAPTPHVQPGQDFASPPSYGPAFPYHTAPASPWAH